MACTKETQTGEFTVEETGILCKLEYEEEILRAEKYKLQEELEIINNKLAGEHDSDSDIDLHLQQRYIDDSLCRNEALQEDTFKAESKQAKQKLAGTDFDDRERKNTPEKKPNENKDHCQLYL